MKRKSVRDLSIFLMTENLTNVVTIEMKKNKQKQIQSTVWRIDQTQ